MAVVGEHHQVVARDQAIRGITINHIHRARRERLILHRGQQRMNPSEVHPVRAREPWQSIGATNEVRCEASPKMRCHTGQIAERDEMQRVGRRVANRDGIRVVEAEWWEPAHAVPLLTYRRDTREHVRRIG